MRCGLHSAWKAVNKIQGLLFLHLKFRLWNLSAEEHSFVQNGQRTRQLCYTMPSQHASHVQPHRTFHAAHPQHPQMFYSFPCVTSFCDQATCLASALSAGRTSSCFAAWDLADDASTNCAARRMLQLTSKPNVLS